MHRRRFFQVAAATLGWPIATRAGLVALADAPRHDFIFFDERFARARHLAADWASIEAARVQAVQGDVTPAWNDGLDRLSRERALLMRGVTTDSFLFCLKVLVGEYAATSTRVLRLDRNLLHWSMTSTPRPAYGITP
jgi:hypothetical protein